MTVVKRANCPPQLRIPDAVFIPIVAATRPVLPPWYREEGGNGAKATEKQIRPTMLDDSLGTTRGQAMALQPKSALMTTLGLSIFPRSAGCGKKSIDEAVRISYRALYGGLCAVLCMKLCLAAAGGEVVVTRPARNLSNSCGLVSARQHLGDS